MEHDIALINRINEMTEEFREIRIALMELNKRVIYLENIAHLDDGK